MQELSQCKITIIYPEGQKEIQCSYGSNLLDILNIHNIYVDAPCGGQGTCGKCKVRIKGAGASQLDVTEIKKISEKERKDGYRLACKVKVEGSIRVILEGNFDAQIISEGKEYIVDLNPYIIKKVVQLDEPTVHDQRDDFKRLTDALGVESINISFAQLRQLPDLLRENDYRVTVVHAKDSILAIEAGDTTDMHYGVAVDIGTTTVVAYLLDLNTGKQLDVLSNLNTQKSFGGDVISRITYTIQHSEGLEQLHQKIILQLQDMVESLAERNHIRNQNIYNIFLAGNTTMMHLLTGISPKNIAYSPFIPVNTQKQICQAQQFGFMLHEACQAGLLPSVSGYVGADIVAAILSSGMSKNEDLSLLIDIGTNGEIALGNKETIFCCSTAAGPAFEGAHIRNGIGGIGGAVNTVTVEQGKFQYTTIADYKPIGICGSGIIDIVAILVNAGIVDETGRIVDMDEIESDIGKRLSERIIEVDDMPAFIVIWGSETKSGEPIIITQQDIREIQLAKAAIAAGINTLIHNTGKNKEDIQRVYLAGGFGSYINTQNAVAIGLLPKELQENIIILGNAAGTGAMMCLLSQRDYEHCDYIKGITQYIELSTSIKFQDEYVNCMYF